MVAGPTSSPLLFEPGRSAHVNPSLTKVFIYLTNAQDLAITMRFEGRRQMHWYNPKTRSTETRLAPQTDAEARELLDGNLDTEAFVTEYERLRKSGMIVEQALIFTGHEFRLRQLELRVAR
jgi:hypothetical protein